MPPETALYQQIGQRLRARRRSLELTQTQVAQACGITFQQVHRYEAGTSSITLARLLSLAAVLQTPITYFLEPEADLGAAAPASEGARWNAGAALSVKR